MFIEIMIGLSLLMFAGTLCYDLIKLINEDF